MAGCLVAAATWLQAADVVCNEKHATFLGGSSSRLVDMYCRCCCEDCKSQVGQNSSPSGRIMNLLTFYRHTSKSEDAVKEAEAQATTPGDLEQEEEKACWDSLSYKGEGSDIKVPFREHALILATANGDRNLVGKKLFVYHFPPGVESQPLLRGGWMRGGIKCYLEETGEFLVNYDNRTSGTLYLGLNYTHFSTRPPLPGSQPQLLPSADPTPGKRKRQEDDFTKRTLPRPPPLNIAQQILRPRLARQAADEDETTVSEHQDEDGDDTASAETREPSRLKHQESRQQYADDGSDAPSGSARSQLSVLPSSTSASPHELYMSGFPMLPGLGGWASPQMDLSALLSASAGMTNPLAGYRLGLLQSALASPTGIWLGSGFPSPDFAALQQQLTDWPPHRKHMPS